MNTPISQGSVIIALDMGPNETHVWNILVGKVANNDYHS